MTVTELPYRKVGDLYVPDHWAADARTDRAIELLHHVGDAKVDASGQVVARHRYSRGHGLGEVLLDAVEGLHQGGSVSIHREVNRGDGTNGFWGSCEYTVEIEGRRPDGSTFVQAGICEWPRERPASPLALAICRALLDYVDDDDEPMTTDDVLTMLEAERQKTQDWRRARARAGG